MHFKVSRPSAVLHEPYTLTSIHFRLSRVTGHCSQRQRTSGRRDVAPSPTPWEHQHTHRTARADFYFYWKCFYLKEGTIFFLPNFLLYWCVTLLCYTMDYSGLQEDSTDTQQAQVEGQVNPNGALGGSTVPPPLSPHYTHPQSATGADFLHLIQYLEQVRIHEDTRRRQEDELRRQEDDRRRQEENARFSALLQRLMPATSSVTTSSPNTSSTRSSVPLPQKAITQNPPPLFKIAWNSKALNTSSYDVARRRSID